MTSFFCVCPARDTDGVPIRDFVSIVDANSRIDTSEVKDALELMVKILSGGQSCKLQG